ncbi:unnamed protein product [Pieris brassicae]|uniref:Complex 1 LYR protein domain-containing protein n=1 Tax=Pieris brassicae TaxID=7116 RepID=A0A9P0TJS4_PIEBR|nr:unnamed protein product [Pieris brassicae]
MSAIGPKSQILALYKCLLRESQKFSSYNIRSYAIRRVRDAFKENKSLSDGKAINNEIKFAKENLEIIKRQTIIGNMYQTDKLVIENIH